LKRVTLELGGKNPVIIFPDANMEVTINQCLLGFVALSGQICASSTRIYVEESFAPVFIKAFQQAVESSVALFGDPQDPNTRVGPIVDAHQHSRVKEFIEAGKSEGTLLTGGEAIGEKVYLPTLGLTPGSVHQTHHIH
jgi:aldehyde dehydrogenase (NAD+)